MNQYQVAGDGLKKMFIAQVGSIVCTLIGLIPIIGKIAGIGSLVFLVISLVGLNQAGKQIAGCKKAFSIQIGVLIASILLSVVGAVLTLLATFVGVLFIAVLGIAVSVLSFIAIYYICTSVSEVLTQMGDTESAKAGDTAWKAMLVCQIVAVIATLLSFVPLLSSVVGFISTVVGVVGAIFYVIFLNKSSTRLAA